MLFSFSEVTFLPFFGVVCVGGVVPFLGKGERNQDFFRRTLRRRRECFVVCLFVVHTCLNLTFRNFFKANFKNRVRVMGGRNIQIYMYIYINICIYICERNYVCIIFRGLWTNFLIWTQLVDAMLRFWKQLFQSKQRKQKQNKNNLLQLYQKNSRKKKRKNV